MLGQRWKQGGEWWCLCGDPELEPKLGNGGGYGDWRRWRRREDRGRGDVCGVERGPRGGGEGEERAVDTPGSGKLGRMPPMAA